MLHKIWAAISRIRPCRCQKDDVVHRDNSPSSSGLGSSGTHRVRKRSKRPNDAGTSGAGCRNKRVFTKNKRVLNTLFNDAATMQQRCQTPSHENLVDGCLLINDAATMQQRCSNDAATMQQRCSNDAATMQQRCSNDAATMQQRCSNDAATMQQRCSNDAATMQQRCSNDAATMQQRCSNDAATMQQRCSNDAATMQQRCSNDAATMQQRCSNDAATMQQRCSNDAATMQQRCSNDAATMQQRCQTPSHENLVDGCLLICSCIVGSLGPLSYPVCTTRTQTRAGWRVVPMNYIILLATTRPDTGVRWKLLQLVLAGV
uniref:Uncharacterized protein n=1 Tax=Brassica oleracea var. oleracea TaxID=109376 RepID=A0A0D3ATN3_BRAOL